MSASEIEPNTSNSDDFNIKDVKEQSKNTEIITNTQFDESLTEEECSFYLKAYPNVEIVRERRVHCTVCRVHLGTAPGQISNIKMHPILRVTHCLNCHEFYNSGEFSRGEDGSELYCRWCGQGGEVYCCSRCPFVFCKSCILKNLQSDIISDIEKNENWNCFYCSPKILWPLRAQHWALMKYIDHQVSKIDALDLPNDEYNVKMNEDNAKCCRLAKSRSSNLSESIESLNSISSKHSDRSNNAKRKKRMSRVSVSPSNNIKRIKVTNNTSNINNDEVVCTPDLLTMLEPDCQLSASPHQMIEPTANVINSTPPPLVLRNSSVQIRSLRDGISYPTSTSPNAPVYHVVNGFRIDLNTAAQKSVYRLPNGKFIQVKRSGVPVVANPNSNSNTWQRPCELRPVMPGQPKTYQRIPIQQQQSTQHFQLQMTPSNDQQQNSIRSPAMQTNINNINLNHINTNNVNTTAGETTIRVPIVRHVFPKTAIGEARSHLQDKVLEAHSICHRFNGKLISFSNSNAYKQVQNYNDIKELYIHMSYMCTYVSECMKTLQDDVLKEMRQLGFVSEANDLKHGQLPAGVDFLRTANSDIDFSDNDEDGDMKSECTNVKIKQEREEINANDEEFEHNMTDKVSDMQNYTETTIAENEENEDCDYYDADYKSNETHTDSRWRKTGTEEFMHREEQSHAYDRKLTRLIQQYPSIWCTMHPNYGNFEVTRQQWRTIASHFQNQEDVKVRWKNIRKRYVRVEQRMREGKRFNGYFDKATTFLANRNLPPEEWEDVDCGIDDGDTYDRTTLDNIEQQEAAKGAKQKPLNHEYEDNEEDYEQDNSETVSNHKMNNDEQHGQQLFNRPIDILPIDMKIINFVKRNQMLWRRVRNDDAHDSNAITQLWSQLCRSLAGISYDDIVYRWHYLYEMYKAFRLKKIKDKEMLANMELKYSKYLSKLYFLYKIDEDILRNECTMINDDFYELEGLTEHLEYNDYELCDQKPNLQDTYDDRRFVLALIRAIKQYPALWNMRHEDYEDVQLRGQLWQKIAQELAKYKCDVKSIKLRWLLIKYNYYRFLRDHDRQTPVTLKFFNKFPMEELNFLKNVSFHR